MITIRRCQFISYHKVDLMSVITQQMILSFSLYTSPACHKTPACKHAPFYSINFYNIQKFLSFNCTQKNKNVYYIDFFKNKKNSKILIRKKITHHNKYYVFFLYLSEKAVTVYKGVYYVCVGLCGHGTIYTWQYYMKLENRARYLHLRPQVVGLGAIGIVQYNNI